MATQRKRARSPVIGTKLRGTILRVDFSGAGPNSGEVLVVVKPVSDPAIGFGIWMDTTRPTFFRLLEGALTAMWDQKTVEVTSVPTDGLAMIKTLKVVNKKR
jgi:hypothetical protein